MRDPTPPMIARLLLLMAAAPFGPSMRFGGAILGIVPGGGIGSRLFCSCGGG